MYPSSSSSSSHGSLAPSSTNTTASDGGLTRYGSAPGSLLTNAVDSVIGSNRDLSTLGSHHRHQHHHHLAGPSRYFSSETAESSNSKTNTSSNANRSSNGGVNLNVNSTISLGGGASAASSSSLIRHSSSPAGFLHQLTHASSDDGFSLTRGIGSFTSKGVSDSRCGISRLNSQLSFTRQEALSQIAEESEAVAEHMERDDNGQRKSTHSFTSASFGMGSWEDGNGTMFSMTPNKRSKSSSGMMNVLHGESQFQFGMPQSSLEMAAMDNFLHIPQDSVPCKIRAKRGCATHPRSIAERERRTRISGKLKMLQDLVPNMDKQTSYADMLDLAVEHIKSLQNQIQNLNNDLGNCTCGCKKSTQ